MNHFTAAVNAINHGLRDNRAGIRYKLRAYQEFTSRADRAGIRLFWQIGFEFGQGNDLIWGNWINEPWLSHEDQLYAWENILKDLQGLGDKLNTHGISWLSNIHDDDPNEVWEQVRRQRGEE